MKIKILTIIKLFMAALCVIMTFWGCTSGQGKSRDLLVNVQPELMMISHTAYLIGEDTLALPGDTIHVTVANNRFAIKDTCLYIAYGGKFNSIDSLADKVDTMSISKLYDTAYKRNTGGHFITVLQIKYGLHNHAVKLYYKPLCLTRDSMTKPGSTYKYGYYSNHNKFDSNYYCYSSGTGFLRAPYKNQFLKDSLNYIDSIRIRHHLNNAIPGYFYTADNDTGDIHSVIYSFQEINALMLCNSGSAYIKISNVGQKVVISSSLSFYKHTILMGPNSLEPGGHGASSGSGVYYNVYAGMAGLCPPSCSEQQYQLK